MFKALAAPGSKPNYVSSKNYTHAMKQLPMEVSKAVDYRIENPKAVRSDHILVTLLNNLGVPLHHEDFIYMSMVESKVNEVASSLDITCTTNVGEAHYNVLYGDHTRHVLVSVEDAFDIDTLWEDLRPIKVLRHSESSLNMDALDGRRRGLHAEPVVVAINIPMLALQYKRWQRWAGLVMEVKPTVAQFIAQYPLNNALQSHVDCALFNRWAVTFIGGVLQYNVGMKKPWAVVDLHDRFDKGLDVFVRVLDRKALSFEEMLGMLPLLSGTALDYFALPDVTPIRQVTWALTYARLPMLAFLIRADFEGSGSKNKTIINDIRVELKRIMNDKRMHLGDSHVVEAFELCYKDELKPYL